MITIPIDGGKRPWIAVMPWEVGFGKLPPQIVRPGCPCARCTWGRWDHGLATHMKARR